MSQAVFQKGKDKRTHGDALLGRNLTVQYVTLDGAILLGYCYSRQLLDCLQV